ncbi:hypothetical protein LAZ67_6003292 [Cordylochernes scorpioides]|uniref:Mos1 transposase HTH domain-containing protein n=1 Tax=Cordylochernes scorpioides TaxID=51811 RepID=A0ABY6KKH5_9ARAC|nr:hypothetical protein LAZ67_6003292 [Cordylochernes scorpioides]
MLNHFFILSTNFVIPVLYHSPAASLSHLSTSSFTSSYNSLVEIHRQLVEVYGEKCMDIKNVRKWCQEFNEGRINVHDEQRSGWPSLPESTVARIDEMVRANRRITLEEIEDGLNEDCSHFSKNILGDRISMELPLVNVSTCELRSVIRFFTAKNETAVNIHRNLVSVYGEGCMSIQMVRRWRSWFLEGRQNVHDDERSDRPVTATDNAAVAAVRNVVEANRRVTIDEIMIRLPPGIEIGCSSIGTIMSDVLNLN